MRLTPEVMACIRELGDESPESIVLQSKRYPYLPMAFIAQQVKARQRIRKKLPSWYANEAIVFPRSLPLEQCTSEYAAAYKAQLLAGGTLADLTGGFGVDALAFAKFFDRVYHVERDPELSDIVAQNLVALRKDSIVTTVTGDGIDWLHRFSDPLDVVYLDPARRDSRSLKVSGLEDCEPNVVQHWNTLLAKGKQVAIKLSPGMDVDELIATLSGIREIHVISIENECKECFCLASEGFKGEPRIVCVNRRKNSEWERFEFTRSSEKKIEGTYSTYSKFLYEPNASIMKAGGFKSLGQKQGLSSLHPRTRFYTSEAYVNHFPGRAFEILETGDLRKKSAAQLFPQGQANVLARNAGLSSKDLKRKLSLDDGGDLFAIGTMDIEGKRRLLKCKRIYDS